MSQSTPDMNETAAKWLKFASQSRQEIASQFSDETRSLFAAFFTQNFGDTRPQGDSWASAEEFAQHVLDLRANEKAWSRQLSDTLLRSDDLASAGRMEQAGQELRAFCDACPWPVFAEIAETQLLNLFQPPTP